MVSVLVACLVTVVGVCLSIGLTHTADRLERDEANAKNLSANKLISSLYYGLDQVRQKSRSAYNDALAKIESIPAISAAGSLKDYLAKVNREANDKYQKAKDLAANVEDTVSGYQTQVMNYANQPDSYKLSEAGSQDLEDLKNKVTDLNDKIETSIGGNNEK